MTSTASRITHSEEWITPDQAQHILDTANDHNRRIRRRRVDQFASDLRAGRWAFNGETIKFNTLGKLVDGQHRLLGAVEAGKPLHTLVVRGLPPESQETVDMGAARTAGDVLHLRDVENSNQVAAVARMVMRWDKGARNNVAGAMAHGEPTSAELLEWIDANPEIHEAARWAYQVSKLGLTPRSAGLCYVLFHRINSHDAEVFFSHLKSGEGLQAGDPVLALRNWGLNQLRPSKLSAGRLAKERESNSESVAAIIKAWNYWRKGHELRRLAVRLGGGNPESFPEPK